MWCLSFSRANFAFLLGCTGPPCCAGFALAAVSDYSSLGVAQASLTLSGLAVGLLVAASAALAPGSEPRFKLLLNLKVWCSIGMRSQIKSKSSVMTGRWILHH